jgi:glycosyltransferase involved in cell wall biosynthesis
LYIKQLVEFLQSTYEIRVIAPVPWLPEWAARKWRPAQMVPREETVDGVRVYHPRYLVIPKVLRFSHGLTFAACIRGMLKALRPNYAFELISVHWIFPDAFGTVLAAKSLHVPIIAHALGCDINDYLRYPLRRRMIRWALSRATAVVTKSEEIASKISSLDIDENKINTIHNGVSRELFKCRDKAEQRSALNLPADKKIILFVGNFAIEKGITYMLQAVAELRRTRDDLILYMIGDGPLRVQVERDIARLGIEECTVLLGHVPHARIPHYLNSADALCLPSLREGCPNVVLESLASGTPVVASSVGAIPEMMNASKIGFMAEPGDISALSQKLSSALSIPDHVDRSFDWPSWEQNAQEISKVFANSIECVASTR